jgi:hypothetical protein
MTTMPNTGCGQGRDYVSVGHYWRGLPEPERLAKN